MVVVPDRQGDDKFFSPNTGFPSAASAFSANAQAPGRQHMDGHVSSLRSDMAFDAATMTESTGLGRRVPSGAGHRSRPADHRSRPTGRLGRLFSGPPSGRRFRLGGGARRVAMAVVAALVAVAGFAVAIPVASAAVGVNIIPVFPANVTVGQVGLPAAVQIVNSSTFPESSGNVTLASVNLVPVCGALSIGTLNGDCPLPFADPGVFQLSPTGTGEDGTGCARQSFTITTINPATGQVTFTPIGGPIIVTPPGTNNSICRIDFTFDVLKAPTKPALLSPPNTVATTQIVFASLVAAVNGILGQAVSSSSVIVTNAPRSAIFTYPVDSQTGVDTTVPFTWATAPQAQNYVLVVGSTLYGTDLVNSAILPPTQSSLTVPALPTGRTLYATLLTKLNGTWTSYQAITFTAGPGQAMLTYPTDGQAGTDPARPFTWTTVAGAQSYILAVGTTPFSTDRVNSGILPPTQTSLAIPALPAGPTLYATLLTKVNGTWARYQTITFTAGPARANLSYPLNGQTAVGTPATFTWTPAPGAQNYYLAVGTTTYGTDRVNSGILPATQMSLPVPALPSGQTLYATILTKVSGTWVYQTATFTAA